MDEPASFWPLGTAWIPDLKISAINGLSQILNAMIPAVNAVKFRFSKTGNP